MKRYRIQNSFCLLLLCVISTACNQVTDEKDSRVETLPYYSDAVFTPHWFDRAPEGFHKIPPFRLVNQDNDTITEADLENKIYIANFFFTTCPGICPKMTANLSGLQDEFLNDEEVVLISHSVTPGIDSVSVLKKYADRKKVLSGKWHLLTGDRDQIYNLGRYSYFIEEDLGLERDPDDFLHTENFVLVDKNRYIRGIYNGLSKNDVAQLIADVKTLKISD